MSKGRPIPPRVSPAGVIEVMFAPMQEVERKEQRLTWMSFPLGRHRQSPDSASLLGDPGFVLLGPELR